MEISAIWLWAGDTRVEVLVEIDGKWYEVINTCCVDREVVISHCAHTKNELPSNAKEVTWLKKETKDA